jgi:hypothetical protein
MAPSPPHLTASDPFIRASIPHFLACSTTGSEKTEPDGGRWTAGQIFERMRACGPGGQGSRDQPRRKRGLRPRTGARRGASMQGDTDTDWKYRADSGKHAGRGPFNGAVLLTQGKLLARRFRNQTCGPCPRSSGILRLVSEGVAARWSWAEPLTFFNKRVDPSVNRAMARDLCRQHSRSQ